MRWVISLLRNLGGRRDNSVPAKGPGSAVGSELLTTAKALSRMVLSAEHLSNVAKVPWTRSDLHRLKHLADQFSPKAARLAQQALDGMSQMESIYYLNPKPKRGSRAFEEYHEAYVKAASSLDELVAIVGIEMKKLGE